MKHFWSGCNTKASRGLVASLSWNEAMDLLNIDLPSVFYVKRFLSSLRSGICRWGAQSFQDYQNRLFYFTLYALCYPDSNVMSIRFENTHAHNKLHTKKNPSDHDPVTYSLLIPGKLPCVICFLHGDVTAGVCIAMKWNYYSPRNFLLMSFTALQPSIF